MTVTRPTLTPAAFVQTPYSETYCYFDTNVYYEDKLPSGLCTFTGDTWTIATPVNYPLVAGTSYRLVISALNNPFGNNGLYVIFDYLFINNAFLK